jgi:hypothetical protein
MTLQLILKYIPKMTLKLKNKTSGLVTPNDPCTTNNRTLRLHPLMKYGMFYGTEMDRKPLAILDKE